MFRVIVLLAASSIALLIAASIFRRPSITHPKPAQAGPIASPAEVADMKPSLPESVRPARSSLRSRIAGLGLAVVVLGGILAAVATFIFLVSPADDTATQQASQSSPPAETSVTAGAEAAASVVDRPSPETPATQVAGADIARIVMPALEINAPIITLGVDPQGTMQSPDNPTDVAWYSFSARPGEVSNIVMAGHLDYINHGPAVFYRINEARPGDELQLVLDTGSVAFYRVLDVTTYDEATAPVQAIVGPTDTEMVTLITCGGSFDPLSREYDKRVVLRAERIAESARTP